MARIAIEEGLELCARENLAEVEVVFRGKFRDSVLGERVLQATRYGTALPSWEQRAIWTEPANRLVRASWIALERLDITSDS